jgi:hypothetical protein
MAKQDVMEQMEQMQEMMQPLEMQEEEMQEEQPLGMQAEDLFLEENNACDKDNFKDIEKPKKSSEIFGGFFEVLGQ